jgi:hypothetical protein
VAQHLWRANREVKVKTKIKLLIGAAAIVITAVGLALATPIVKLVSPLLAVGNQSADIHKRGTAVVSNGEPFRVELETDGPSTFSIQDAAFAAGGRMGGTRIRALSPSPFFQAASDGTTRIVPRQSTRLVTAGWRVVKFMPSAT